MAKKKWIAGAIKKRGSLTRMAKAKGVSISQFCSQSKSKLSTVAQQRCNLAKTLKKMPRRSKGK